MRFKGLQLLVSTLAAVTLCSYILYETSSPVGIAGGPDANKDKVLMETLMTSLNNSHFQPKEVNDGFSMDVFQLYLSRLDFNKRFFLLEDVKVLTKYDNQIDDQIQSGSFDFFDTSYEMLVKRINEAATYYQEILDKPFDFSEREELELDRDKREWASSEEELKSIWNRTLKYQAMLRIHEMQRKQEEASEENDTLTILTFEQMEQKARAGLLKNNDRFFERMKKWSRDDLKEVYINSIMNVFGPHTGYFPPKDKENFDISMSGQLEGIGAQLQEKDGYIKVSSIVPGSPSYLQGELEEGDLILKVAQEGKPAIDVVDMRLDDAVKLIRGKKGTVVILTVKKPNGYTKDVPITRDIVVLAETYAKSAFVRNETGKKVGYIKLPKFYADFNKLGGRSAAEDVRVELEKLKAEGVDGVVLDLRGNGGGSLRDAIEMTGHFVDYGPVVQIKGRFSSPEIMRDSKRDVVYDGPLVVMVNHFSASASEIVAAAIQDYDRGIILGANASFGKGTVQRFLDLDRALTPSNASYRPLGALKVTTQKFYRINGGATQLKGVTPDITLPDKYNYMDMGEKEHDYVMPWDEIPAASYEIWKTPYDEQEVINNSMKRVASNETFQMIEQNATALKAQSEETMVSLKWEEFIQRQQMLDEEDDKYDDLIKPIEGLVVENLSVDMEQISSDTVQTDINDKWVKKLKKDVMLNEAIYVLSDMAN